MAEAFIETKDPERLKKIYANVNEKVLVACPTFKGKAYALEAYIAAYNNFVYPYRSLFMVDNSGTGLSYYRKLQELKVPVVHINPTRDFQETFAASWKRILEEAQKGQYDWILSIEADNICPPVAVDVLLNVAGYCRAVHVAHAYPWHMTQSEYGLLIGLGCNLIHRTLLEAVFNREEWYTNAFEAEIFEYCKIHKLPSIEIYNLFEIEHLDDKAGSDNYIFERPEIPKRSSNKGVEKKPMFYVNKPNANI